VTKEDVKKQEDAEKTVESNAPTKIDPQLEAAQKEAKENFNKYLYLRAEFENFKKRVQKEELHHIQYGIESFARDVLDAVDNLERSLQFVKDDKDSLVQGIQLTLKQLHQIFDKFGIRPIESLGKKFDPNFHEAVDEKESDKEHGTILLENRKGYMLRDRLLRSAHVVVSKKQK